MMRHGRPWHLYLLALLTVVLAVLAATAIGAPGRSARVARETVTVEDGVVQSTVTGTGNVEAGTDVDVNFQTSGTLQTIDVSVGQHVNEGQLLATLDQTSAQLAVNQAQESVTAAEDQLTAVENGTATGSGGSTGGQTASLVATGAGSTEFVTLVKAPAKKRAKPKPPRPAPARPVPARPAPARRAPARPAPARLAPAAAAPQARSSGTSATRATATAPATTTTTTTPSPASIASAQAAVYSAEANLHNAQQALVKTNLYAPASGTIVSLASLSPGDPVSAGNSGAAVPNGGGSGSGGSGAGSSSGAGASSGAGGASSSSTPFAQIVDASTLTMAVAFSESDVSKVAVGQSAVVTMDALSGVELAAHVSSISTVGTTTNGVVSYDATLTLDQTDPRVKPGMSASASVITGQASGVTVPNQAVSGTGSVASVEVLQDGKPVPKQVIVGLRGSSRTQILSGLSAGQQVVVTITLPALSTPSSSTTPGNGTLGRGLGGGGGGAGFGGGGGFRAIFGGSPGGGG